MHLLTKKSILGQNLNNHCKKNKYRENLKNTGKNENKKIKIKQQATQSQFI